MASPIPAFRKALEDSENSLFLADRHPDTVVLDPKTDVALALLGPDPYLWLSIVRNELHSVGEQIRHDLYQRGHVTAHGGERLLDRHVCL